MDVDDFWAEARPAVAAHRCRAYLESLALPPQEAAHALAQSSENLDMANLETTEAELMHTVFPHPTLSEMMKEAVLDAYGRVLNV